MLLYTVALQDDVATDEKRTTTPTPTPTPAQAITAEILVPVNVNAQSTSQNGVPLDLFLMGDEELA